MITIGNASASLKSENVDNGCISKTAELLYLSGRLAWQAQPSCERLIRDRKGDKKWVKK